MLTLSSNKNQRKIFAFAFEFAFAFVQCTTHVRDLFAMRCHDLDNGYIARTQPIRGQPTANKNKKINVLCLTVQRLASLALRSIHNKRMRKRKRTFSLMFENFPLIFFACTLILFAFAFAFTRCEQVLSLMRQSQSEFRGGSISF